MFCFQASLIVHEINSPSGKFVVQYKYPVLPALFPISSLTFLGKYLLQECSSSKQRKQTIMALRNDINIEITLTVFYVANCDERIQTQQTIRIQTCVCVCVL